MKIIISGKPEKIADLADAMQRRTMKRELELRASKDAEDLKAMERSISFLRGLKAEGWDPEIQSYQGRNETP